MSGEREFMPEKYLTRIFVFHNLNNIKITDDFQISLHQVVLSASAEYY